MAGARRRIRLLAIDSSDDLLQCLDQLLIGSECPACSIERAESVLAAMKANDETPSDLFVLGHGVSDADALELIRLQSQQPRQVPCLRVLQTRSKAEKDLPNQGLGASQIVAAPLTPATLHAAVRLAVEPSRDSGSAVGRAEDLLSLIEQLPLGVAVVDAALCLRATNAPFRQTMGLSRAQLAGRALGGILAPMAPTSSFDPVVEVLRGSLASSSFDALAVRPEGSLLRVQYTVVGLPRDEAVGPTGLLLQTAVFPWETKRARKLAAALGPPSDRRAGRQSRRDVLFPGIVGRSREMQGALERTLDVARVETTVLITGETGTGKELVARAIHELSSRRYGAFVAVNCAGLTDSLLASQLFGHRRGAFTGASQEQRGFFEAANGGTLFLDEIGDITSAVQTSLLRVLEEQEIIRLGDSVARPIDVRVVAATHRDLHEEVAKGRFRADLFYRVQVARIGLPALRERPVDIPLLAEGFLADCCRATGKSIVRLRGDTVRHLMAYKWPGNVRELKSAIEYAVIGCRRDEVTPNDLPPEILSRRSSMADETSEAGEPWVQRLDDVLSRVNGNRSAAARLLGISRATLYRRLRSTEVAQGCNRTIQGEQTNKTATSIRASERPSDPERTGVIQC